MPAWTRPGWQLELHLGISNPNVFDLSLLAHTYSLQVAPLPLATGEVQEKFLFPAGIETDMRLPVPLKFSGLLGILSHAPDPDNTIS